MNLLNHYKLVIHYEMEVEGIDEDDAIDRFYDKLALVNEDIGTVANDAMELTLIDPLVSAMEELADASAAVVREDEQTDCRIRSGDD